jgi:hypothetical protein
MTSPDDPVRDELARLREKNQRLLRRVLGQPDPQPDPELPPAA